MIEMTAVDGKIYAKIEHLKEWEKNPRSITKDGFERLKKQIQKHGQYKPIITTADGIVIGGNMRLKAYRELGILSTWVSIVEVKDEAQMMEIALSDNDRAGFYDTDSLANLVPNFNIDWNMYGVDIKEPLSMGELVASFSGAKEDQPDLTRPDKPKSKLGHIYKLGRHRLMCGDSTDSTAVAKLMDGKDVRLIFTSPPYNMGGEMYKNYTDNLLSEEYIKFNLNVLANWLPSLQGFIFWNISYNKRSRWEFIEIMYKMIKDTGLKFLELIVWNKGHGLPITSKEVLTRQYEDILALATEVEDVDFFPIYTNQKKYWFNKKTQKLLANYWYIPVTNVQLADQLLACFPVALPYKGIQMMTEENDIVADPFGGSGTTLIAAEQLKRNCYMMELDPGYCDVIRKRYTDFMGYESKNFEVHTPEVK